MATNAILQVTVALSHGVKKRNELRKVSRRKEEEKRQEKGRRKKTEEKYFRPKHLHPQPTHLRRLPTHYLDEKREGRGNERRTLVSRLTFNTCQKRARRRKRGGEKGSRKCRKYFWPTFKLTLRPPPPLPHPVPTDSTN